jgi:hypothetical protein
MNYPKKWLCSFKIFSFFNEILFLPDGAHFGEFENGFVTVLNRLGEELRELLVVEDLQ